MKLLKNLYTKYILRNNIIQFLYAYHRRAQQFRSFPKSCDNSNSDSFAWNESFTCNVLILKDNTDVVFEDIGGPLVIFFTEFSRKYISSVLLNECTHKFVY